MGNYLRSNPTLKFHYATLSVSWYALANVAIIAALFKHTPLGYYIHAILSFIIVSFSLISPLLFIAPEGINFKEIHYIIGTIILFYIGLQALSGFLARVFQQSPKLSSLAIIRTKKFHRFSGYILLIVAKYNCYNKWYKVPAVWIPLAVWDVLCVLIYIKIKWFSKSFEKSVVNQRVFALTQNDVKNITNLEELENGKLGYVTFANYVYDVTPLINLHPAGYQIIKPARGRQVDRFLYGMYGAQGFSSVGRFSHPDNSLKLLGQPIAKINIKSLYTSMEELNQCQIVQSILISPKSDIYLFRFSLKVKTNLVYQGYSEVNQIGGYFSLTIKNTTRLYTKVGCLRAQNIILVKKIMESQPLSSLNNNKKKIEMAFKTNRSNYEATQNDILMKKSEIAELPPISSDKLNSSIVINNTTTIPLLIKVYPGGDLTPNLMFKQQQNMQISCQRGQGLQLDTLSPGKLIFIAGGTGFYPFMDLVDLLFKRCIISINDIDQNITNKIRTRDPIVKSSFLDDFEFKFYIGVHSVQDLHPITLYQLYYLSTSKIIHCIFKLHQSQTMHKQYQDFQLTKQLFHDVALDDIRSVKTSKTFICGPPVMLDAFANLFKENDVQRSRYQFV